MVSRFTAIPVGQGDAFLLERDERVILVDGGRARRGFPTQLGLLQPKVGAIDVVVCTHADADHTEGIVGLLESWPEPISEVWLPGRWTDRLLELCASPESFLDELHADVRAADEAVRQRPLETETGREDPPGSLDGQRNEPNDGGEARTPSINEEVDAALGACEEFDSLDTVLSGPWWMWASGPPWTLWVDAVRTARRIRDIARAAYHRGARIRWFDFEEAARLAQPHGGEPFLRPLNSVELTRRSARRKIRALEFLRLTVVNKESLVFLSPEDENNSAVVFSADSDLATVGPFSVSRPAIVTAPHHGSEANSTAYSMITHRLGSVQPVWIRSDGKYRKRPGPTFLSSKNRACTLCRGSSLPKAAVAATDSAAGWLTPHPSCSCR